jgi:predicted TIM-barrel fold metal-dependent hydrolase
MHYPELSLRDMETYLHDDKFVGAKYNGEYSRAAACAPENREVFTLLEKVHRKPLLLHTWGLPEHGNAVAYSLPAQALELAHQHPELVVIMGHMGGTEWMSAIRAADQAANLYTDMQSSIGDRDKVGAAVHTRSRKGAVWLRKHWLVFSGPEGCRPRSRHHRCGTADGSL